MLSYQRRSSATTSDYRFKLQPFGHQLDAWDLSKDKESYALFMEMGTGKSKVAIDTAAYLYDKGEVDAMLIIAPKGAYRTWDRKQVPEHMPDHIDYVHGVWSSYQTKAVKENLKAVMQLKSPTPLRILSMNVEALSQKGKAFKFAMDFVKNFRCIVVVDESTAIKNMKANRTKNVIAIGKEARYRRILNGYPITRSPLDLYAQCRFLDPKAFHGASFFAFRNRYAILENVVLGQRRFQKVVGFQRLDELQREVRSFSFRVTKDEALDLPPKIYHERDIELTDEQQTLYEQMRKRAVLDFQESGMVAAPIVITRLLRLHQIVCGHIITDDGTVVDIKNNRIAGLMEGLEEADEKVIIWAVYNRDILRIHEALREAYGDGCAVHYYGKTSDDGRDRAIDDFCNGNTRFFIGSPATGKYSLTLNEGHDVFYYSNSHDLDARVQSEDRCHRIGQECAVNYVDLVARKTIDETILKSNREKKSLADMITDGECGDINEML